MFKKLLVSFLLFIPIIQSIYAGGKITPGGMVGINYNFTEKANGFSSFTSDMRITHEPGSNGLTFYASQFFFTSGQGGYIGLQNIDGNRKVAIFSIWDAIDGKFNDGKSCETFGGEGVGKKCMINYNWQEGEKYQFITKRVSSTQKDQIWQASITELSTNKTTIIGKITVSAQSKGLKPSISPFIENFAQDEKDKYNSCSDVPTTTAVFYPPTMDNQSPSSTSSSNYGNCAQIAKSYCTTEGECIGAINSSNQAIFKPFILKNPINQLCADSLNGENVMGLYHCNINNNNQRLQSNNVNHGLYLTNRDQCLQPNANNIVSLASCSNSNAQRWLYLSNTQRYLNLKTGLCMDAAGGAQILKNVQLYLCQTNNQYQKWVISK